MSTTKARRHGPEEKLDAAEVVDAYVTYYAKLGDFDGAERVLEAFEEIVAAELEAMEQSPVDDREEATS